LESVHGRFPGFDLWKVFGIKPTQKPPNPLQDIADALCLADFHPVPFFPLGSNPEAPTSHID
jgi:hypothetical protein